MNCISSLRHFSNDIYYEFLGFSFYYLDLLLGIFFAHKCLLTSSNPIILRIVMLSSSECKDYAFTYCILKACRVPSNMWSKIGRLKRSVMPKLSRGSSVFGSGASPGIMSCIAGRLLCDTLICSRDLLKEVGSSILLFSNSYVSYWLSLNSFSRLATHWHN